MIFRTAKQALVDILGNAASAEQYRVVGYQRQSLNPETVVNENRRVTVYYKGGEFSPSSSSLQGPVKHEMDFAVELTVAAKAQGDVSAIEDPSSTASERATAATNFQVAAEICDTAMDEFIDVVFNVLMDNRRIRLDDDLNGDLQVNDRWISRITKNDPLPAGDHVLLTAELPYRIQCKEQILGEDVAGAMSSVIIDLLVEDDVNEGRAGVEE